MYIVQVQASVETKCPLKENQSSNNLFEEKTSSQEKTQFYSLQRFDVDSTMLHCTECSSQDYVTYDMHKGAIGAVCAVREWWEGGSLAFADFDCKSPPTHFLCLHIPTQSVNPGRGKSLEFSSAP